MRRKPQRRPPTPQEAFLSFAFVLLAFSIAWGAIYQPLGGGSEMAELDKPAVRTVHFPADGSASVEIEPGEPPAVDVRKANGGKVTWATALAASQE